MTKTKVVKESIPVGNLAPNTKITLDLKSFYQAVYESLRNEIIQRISLANNIQSLALVLAGGFISAALQPSITSSLYLVYPPLALFLALGWLHNDLKRFQIAEYLRIIEREAATPAWALHHLDIKKKVGFTSLLERASTVGLFLGLSILTTLLGLTAVTGFGVVDRILIATDALSILGLVSVWFAARAW